MYHVELNPFLHRCHICTKPDQLPGGKFCDPSPELYERAKSCGPDNVSGKLRYGMVDA